MRFLTSLLYFVLFSFAAQNICGLVFVFIVQVSICETFECWLLSRSLLCLANATSNATHETCEVKRLFHCFHFKLVFFSIDTEKNDLTTFFFANFLSSFSFRQW